MTKEEAMEYLARMADDMGVEVTEDGYVDAEGAARLLGISAAELRFISGITDGSC
jgi:hypothetical protein